MSLKLILRPCNEHFLPISSPTTISVDSIKSQLRSPQKKVKAVIDVNSEFTLDYTPPICLSPHSSVIQLLSSSPLATSLYQSQNLQQIDKIKIIDIKYFIASQIYIKPEKLSLYMFNPSTASKFQLLHDYEDFMTYNQNDQKSTNHRRRKCSSSTSDDGKQKVLYFKIGKEKQKIIIDIFQNQIEKLIFNISLNCSVYMLKHLINIKLSSSIPLENFSIYGVGYVDNSTYIRINQPLNKALSNKVFHDEVLIQEIVKYYSIDGNHSNRNRDMDRERTNSILNLILIKKTKDKCIMGLDFRFNYMRNFIKFTFDNNAPAYRETSDGLNLFVYCMNPHCEIAFDYYIVVKGYGHFDIMEEITGIKCPICYSVKKDLRNIGFVKSKWKYKGLLKNKKDSRIEGDGLTLDNLLYVFQEVLFMSQFHILIIETEAYMSSNVSNRNNDVNNSSKDNDSSSELNDISLCYPKEGPYDPLDRDNTTDHLQLVLKQRSNNNNNNIIIKNEPRANNKHNEPDEIIIEGKDKTNCYGCSIFSKEVEQNGNNKMCSCLIF